ncbi:neurotrophin 1-like [Teleopsis dalmanni]|uniref:neurotrophin 1-like n=1 Tax=Teleopsis dalmanni TaxID=139649 RepID=UPI0018CF4405|nr:neurotrophin 1-like [Teleopsis dalmanni]XP_037955496.1 neurotrophin 1-like [Teleopsis dalmanni]
MKAGQSIRCLFWAVLYCVLYLVTASEDDVMDFDFSDLKEIDWNYNNENASNEMTTTSDKKVQSNYITFDDFDDEDNQVNLFDWREKILKMALSKALTNASLRQKFVEVMPILRVLSSPQRLALSALISAQINAKQGQELKLEQVRMMFGDDKKLLIPIVYDIANLVRNSARKYIKINEDESPAVPQQQEINRRKLDLTSLEVEDDDATKDVGTIQVTKNDNNDDDELEDFLKDFHDDVLDPIEINKELQETTDSFSNNADTITIKAKRYAKRDKRSLQGTDFVHKLIRSVPLSVNEDDLLSGAAGRTIKLNTTAFATNQPTSESLQSASALSYQEIEDLAFASLNGTELKLTGTSEDNKENAEPLPNPEELIAGPRYRVSSSKLRPTYAKGAKRKRVQVRTRPNSPPHHAVTSAVQKKCERFTASMCLHTEDYPLEQIMGSIRRHKNAMSALLAEYHDKYSNADLGDEFDDFAYTKKRREDSNSGGGMCQSIVRYARPQKARSASGEWKYIVNTGQHTQTLRLEKCTSPQDSCSYLAHNYRSHCAQVYNYHRLLSWDKTRGLHVDIFKVPTCCSCQIDGYRQQFPPLEQSKAKEYQTSYHNEPYSTINDDLDYNEEDDEDDLSYQYSNGFSHHKPSDSFDDNELLLGSKKVRTKVFPPPGSTIGSYLSPPGSDEYDTNYAYKAQRGKSSSYYTSTAPSLPTTSKNLLSHLARRRPYKVYSSRVDSDALADLDISPSEKHADKEVNIFGTPIIANDRNRLPQKRNQFYSVPHTATSTTIITADATNTISTIPTATGTIPDKRSNSIATTTHQTEGTSTSNNAPSGGNTYQNSGSSSSKTKSRFYPSAPDVSPAFTPTTQSTYYYKQPTATTSAHPSIYHVNAIYDYNGHDDINGGSGPKRINYNYHPIIDFFENHKQFVGAPGTSGSITKTTTTKTNPIAKTTLNTVAREMLYPHKIPKSTPFGLGHQQVRERRIGYGAGGGSHSIGEDNAWHPVVMDT